MLGYGSQGRAHALNLKDSGFKVVVGVRKGGASWKQAKRDGLAVAEPVEAVERADLVAMLVPDMAQTGLYASIKSALKWARRCCLPTASTFTSSRSSRARTSTWC